MELEQSLVDLSSLGLKRYQAQFEDEAITELSLLKTMGPDGLDEAMEELCMDKYAASTLKAALFPGSAATGKGAADDDGDDELELEENDGGDDDELELEENDDVDDDDGLELEANDQDDASPTGVQPLNARSIDVGNVDQALHYKGEGNKALQARSHVCPACVLVCSRKDPWLLCWSVRLRPSLDKSGGLPSRPANLCSLFWTRNRIWTAFTQRDLHSTPAEPCHAWLSRGGATPCAPC